MAKEKTSRNRTVPRAIFVKALKSAEKSRSSDNETTVVTIDMNKIVSFLEELGFTTKKTSISQRIYKLNKKLSPKLKFVVESEKREPQDYSMFLDAFEV